MRAVVIPALWFAVMIAGVSWGSAAEPEHSKPVRALLICGGCCHDYTAQKKIISEGVSARANVVWCLVQQGGTKTNSKIPIYKNPLWYKGFDVVVHDECFSDVTDPQWVERILKPHRDGLPAVVLHCANHCYRMKSDEWFKFCGVTSHHHGPQIPIKAVNLAKDNPIMEGFGESWTTPNEEQYQIEKVAATTSPLAKAYDRFTKKEDVVIWTNMYGQGRVFGTTIGHNDGTVSLPQYLDLVTRGLLWSVGRLDQETLRPLRAEDKVELPDPTPAKDQQRPAKRG